MSFDSFDLAVHTYDLFCDQLFFFSDFFFLLGSWRSKSNFFTFVLLLFLLIQAANTSANSIILNSVCVSCKSYWVSYPWMKAVLTDSFRNVLSGSASGLECRETTCLDTEKLSSS